jgi:hypothetical protein
MKKVLIVLASVVFCSVMMTSCGSTHSCPAYGKVHKVPAEHQV